eukprot:Hpha_TRINITY_DN12966_c0_g1::TRINITY_DN12966_c0_g1_i1::g.164652::m.164652/K15285/SLC35E3; solute carrier family 35, member E3
MGEAAERESSERMKTLIFMALNIVSVVSIVVVNKKIFSYYEFKFGNALMALHYYATAICITLYQRLGGFELLPERPAVFPTRKNGVWVMAGSVLPISMYQVGSVMFVNFSLMYNSVGLYQVLKLANIPVLCVIEYFWKGITYSLVVRSALAVLIGGIGLTSVSDISFNWLGFTHGMIATFTTAAYQILVKDLSKGMSSVQSCYYVTPVTAVIFTMLVPFTDDVEGLLNYKWTIERAVVIFGSAFIAFMINLSVFVIVGRTSPLTYQVVGHVKTTLVLLSGFLFFQAPPVLKNILGMALAMVGVVWYTQANMAEAQAEKARKEAEKAQKEAKEQGQRQQQTADGSLKAP